MTYEQAAAEIPCGLYRHFKGNHYKVLSIGRHSETEEPMVVYQALYGGYGIWIRPAAMWNETVERDGNRYQRFCLLTREERVAFYEELYDDLSTAIRAAGPLSDEKQKKAELLEEYYTSGEWCEDYEADEAGLLPTGLKRGVLSQDGVFDLLEYLMRNF